MNHPEHILRTLDRHLLAPTRLILYGRAALALGFPQPCAEFHTTLDVDAILPEVEMEAIDADEQFWCAVERTNDELQDSGLYMTHLFTDSQVILRPDWLTMIVPIQFSGLNWLTLFRPATEDLLLTKMMRVDPQDRDDLRFLLQQLDQDRGGLDAVFAEARIPDIPEIRGAFEENSIWIGRILGER
jgi:hypothetical protein